MVILGCKNQIETTVAAHPEQAVIIHFQYGIQGLDSLYQLENKIEKLMKDSKIGEYDGHEIAVDYSDGFLYFYGNDADKLFNEVKPILISSSFMKNAEATLRYGSVEDKNVKEKRVVIN